MNYSLPGSSVNEISQARIWSGLQFPTPGDLPEPGIKIMSLASHALAGRFFTTSTTWEVLGNTYFVQIATEYFKWNRKWDYGSRQNACIFFAPFQNLSMSLKVFQNYVSYLLLSSKLEGLKNEFFF